MFVLRRGVVNSSHRFRISAVTKRLSHSLLRMDQGKMIPSRPITTPKSWKKGKKNLWLKEAENCASLTNSRPQLFASFILTYGSACQVAKGVYLKKNRTAKNCLQIHGEKQIELFISSFCPNLTII